MTQLTLDLRLLPESVIAPPIPLTAALQRELVTQMAAALIAVSQAGGTLRGYPETFSHCRNEIKQPPCGNETRGDRRERVC